LAVPIGWELVCRSKWPPFCVQS